MGDMGDYWRDVKAAKKEHTKAVVRVNQAPLNPKRWCIELECRHEVWVTRNGRPQVQKLFCAKCAETATAPSTNTRQR